MGQAVQPTKALNTLAVVREGRKLRRCLGRSERGGFQGRRADGHWAQAELGQE